MKSIAILLLFLAITLAVDISHSSVRKHKSKWFFNGIFKWETATFTVSGSSKEYSFSGKINSNERGIYFKELSDIRGDLKFFDETTYKHNIEGADATVLDYQLMPKCKFSRVDDSVFSGFKFAFELRNFQRDSYKPQTFQVQIAFKWGSKMLGSVDPEKIISQLKKDCNARQTEIEKQRVAAKLEEEKKRIEAERLRLEQEQKIAEEKRKKEEEERKAEEKRKLEEQRAKLAEAERESKELERKAEEERKKKIEEERKAEEARKKKEEEAKREEEKRKAEEQRRIEEQKAKIEAEEKAKRETERKAEEEKLKRIQIELKAQEEKRKKEEEEKKAEQDRKAEELRKRIEEEVRKLAEEKAKIEQEKKAEEEKLKKLNEEIKAEEEKRQREEEAKKAEEEKKLLEIKKKEEERKKQEEAREEKIKEETSFDKEEKKNIEITNTIKVHFDTGYGRALYITGADASLGNWKTAYKLKVVKADEWHYASNKLVDGLEFKTIIYNWVNEESIELKEIPQRNILWENKPGKEGNKITKFVDNMMEHKPSFLRKRRLRN